MNSPLLERKPGESFPKHVAVTLQDVYLAFQFKDLVSVRQSMCAIDFPRSHPTWPQSQPVLAEQTAHLTTQEGDWIWHSNVAD